MCTRKLRAGCVPCATDSRIVARARCLLKGNFVKELKNGSPVSRLKQGTFKLKGANLQSTKLDRDKGPPTLQPPPSPTAPLRMARVVFHTGTHLLEAAGATHEAARWAQTRRRPRAYARKA